MSWLAIPANLLYSGITKTETDPHAVPYTQVGVGLGNFVTVYDGWFKLWQSGVFPTFVSLSSMYPDLGLGIFTSSSGPGLLRTITQEHLHHAIVHILQGMYQQK